MIESHNRRGLDALRRLPDEDLAREAQRGDEGAARVLVERFEEPLYRYTVALIRDADLAREATWSALFEAARAVRANEYTEPVAPWLFHIAHTAADVAGGRPEGRAPDDEAAARAAAAASPDRERLETLLGRLDALPARDRGSLLLRELVGLEYAGIAKVTGARAGAARQAVYRARMALHGGEPPGEHCDEIRAAMSKAEGGVRERRSIASHLETCPDCEAFAQELEQRPADLKTLFPAPAEPLAAELVPPLPPVSSSAASRPRDRGRRPRRNRALLVPLVLGLLLVGAAIATAIALNDNGGGKKTRASAVVPGGAAKPSSQGKAAAPKGGKAAAPKGSSPGKAKGVPATPPSGGSKQSGSSGPSSSSKGTGSGGGSSSGGGGSSSGAPCPPGPAAAPAVSGYSSRGGVAQAEIQDCAHGSRAGGGAGAGGGGLAGTGLDVTPLIAAGLLLLGLGFGLRRLGVRTEPRN